MSAQHYTVVFVFSEDLSKVVLIEKNRPSDPIIHGRLNGLGGKIEKNESSTCGARREVYEESGMALLESDLKLFAYDSTDPDSYRIFFFGAKSRMWDQARTVEGEKVVVMEVEDVMKLPPERVCPNVKWLMQAFLANAHIGEFFNVR